MRKAHACAHCGHVITNARAKFCGQCGVVLTADTNAVGPPQWWEQFRHRPIVFYPMLIVSAFITILTIGVSMMDVITSIPQVSQQLNEWGLLRSTEQEQPYHTLILIASFYSTHGSDTADTQGEIKEAILHEIQAFPDSMIDVVLIPNVLRYDDRTQAEEIAKQQYDASIIIWGDITDARVRVSFLNMRQVDRAIALSTMDRNSLTQPAILDAYAQFLLGELRPRATFLALFTIGEALTIREEYDQAVRVVERAVTLATTMTLPVEGLSPAYFRIGWLYQYGLSRKDGDKAKTAYQKAIAVHTSSEPIAMAYNNLGNLLADGGKSREAIEAYTRALSYDANTAIVYANRGTAYYDIGDLDQSIVDYTKAIEKDPQCFIAYFNRGNTRFKQEDYTQAIRDFTLALEITKSPQAYTNRGIAFDKMGHHIEAITDFDEALALNGQLPQPYYHKGLAYVALGLPDLARIEFENALVYTSDTYHHDLIQQQLRQLDDATHRAGPRMARVHLAQRWRVGYVYGV